jgi:hypothetical protein
VPASHRRRIFGNRGDRAHGGGETITAAEFGPDQVAVLPESLAQRRDLNLEISHFDKNARPNKGQELVLCNKSPIGVDESHQEIEGASAQFHRHAIGKQLPAPRQYAETAELQRRVGRRRVRLIPEHSRTILTPWLALLSWYDRLWLHDPVPPLSVRSSNLAMTILSAAAEPLLDDFAVTGTFLLYCDSDDTVNKS